MSTKKNPAAKKLPVKNAASRAKAGTSKKSSKERRKLFVEAYITNGGNATQAAITAGYSANGAGAAASRLLKDVKVSQEIANRARDLANKYELTTELAVRSIYQELTFDPAKLYDEAGQLRKITDLDEDTRMALASVEFEQQGTTEAPIYVRKVKWAARYQAREQLMKHLGMFSADNKQRASVRIIDLGGR